MPSGHGSASEAAGQSEAERQTQISEGRARPAPATRDRAMDRAFFSTLCQFLNAFPPP